MFVRWSFLRETNDCLIECATIFNSSYSSTIRYFARARSIVVHSELCYSNQCYKQVRFIYRAARCWLCRCHHWVVGWITRWTPLLSVSSWYVVKDDSTPVTRRPHGDCTTERSCSRRGTTRASTRLPLTLSISRSLRAFTTTIINFMRWVVSTCLVSQSR